MGKARKKRNRGHLTKAEAIKAVNAIEIEGKPVRQVQKDLNYAESTFNTHSKQLTQNPLYVEAKNALQDAILKRNSTIFDKTARVVDEGLDANVTKFFAHEGRVIETRDAIDHVTRHKYAEIVSSIFGFKHPEAGGGVTFNIAQLVMMIKQAEQERGLQSQ